MCLLHTLMTLLAFPPTFYLLLFRLPSSFYSQMKDYLQTDLLPMIYSAGDQDQMMEESQEAAQRREEMIRMYHCCKDALTLISEVSTKTGRYLVQFQDRCRLGMRLVGLVLQHMWQNILVYSKVISTFSPSVHTPLPPPVQMDDVPEPTPSKPPHPYTSGGPPPPSRPSRPSLRPAAPERPSPQVPDRPSVPR